MKLSNFPFGIFIKYITDSDMDFHSHSRSCFSLVLKGCFYEHLLCTDDNGKKLVELTDCREAGSLRFLSKSKQHKMELISNGAVVLYFTLIK